jgi:hypothetical protein
MPSSQRHMGVRLWPGLGAQRVWLSPGALLACDSVTIATTLLLSRGLLLRSRHAIVSWEARATAPSSLTRVCWTCPARESKVSTRSPRPTSGRRREARSKPPRRLPREDPHEALIGRAAVPRGAAGRRPHGDGCRGWSRPPGGKPRIVRCSPGLGRPMGATGTALGRRDGLRATYRVAQDVSKRRTHPRTNDRHAQSVRLSPRTSPPHRPVMRPVAG